MSKIIIRLSLINQGVATKNQIRQATPIKVAKSLGKSSIFHWGLPKLTQAAKQLINKGIK
jgi:hypothetical protein